MADTAFRAQPSVLADDFGQLVGVQTTLHQQLGIAEAHQLDSLRRCGVAVRDIDDFVAAEIEFELLGDVVDLCRRADK